jgi:hypothetical protein
MVVLSVHCCQHFEEGVRPTDTLARGFHFAGGELRRQLAEQVRQDGCPWRPRRGRVGHTAAPMSMSCSAELTVQSNDAIERPLRVPLVFFAVFPLLGGIAAAIP